ncbi:MAG TPA: UDP-N-acetyl-D-mannosamine dehydrogenase [Rhizomicrobium sp.]|jgi:UDP-N-acetyl-D-mannosaminuronic acid dehydrogenase|nr:UDP-N-acetyl-D-mannosamine dehydrogenase [Rhizomicrobium sp.]
MDSVSGEKSAAAFKKVSVFGLGYVGLPVSAVLASRGVEVVGVDVNPHAVSMINNGRIHIVEPDLEMLVQAAVSNGKLRATLEPEPADAFVIAVPTPFTDDRQPDLSYVKKATETIAPLLQKGNLVILESTSPVGTTELICKWIGEIRPDLVLPDSTREGADVHVAHCPERVLPGTVVRELIYNDRIIGGVSPACARRGGDLYSLFVTGELHLTTARTAELGKLVENAFRDVNIAFANELSVICDELHVNVWELIDLANHHPRVNILKPGPGVGGHCIAVDPWFIIAAVGEKARVMRAARDINDSMPGRVVAKVKSAANRFRQPKVACLGLAYKPNIDDLRESPAVHVVEMLAKADVGELLVVEPNVKELPASLRDLPGLRKVELREALSEADIVVLLVDHRQFLRVDRELLDLKIVIDTRGAWRTSTPEKYSA